MSKHTQGPWRIVIDDDGNQLSGRPSVSATEEMDCAIVHWDGFKQTYWQSARGEKEMHANARLIAAAPELLDALTKLLDQFDSEIHNEYYGTGMLEYRLAEANHARAAIAKATGEAK